MLGVRNWPDHDLPAQNPTALLALEPHASALGCIPVIYTPPDVKQVARPPTPATLQVAQRAPALLLTSKPCKLQERHANGLGRSHTTLAVHSYHDPSQDTGDGCNHGWPACETAERRWIVDVHFGRIPRIDIKLCSGVDRGVLSDSGWWIADRERPQQFTR